MRVLEKVTIFITRPSSNRGDLLLFEHASTGIQIPAGTVEAGEAPLAAAWREAREESGLPGLDGEMRSLGDRLEPPQPGHLLIHAPTRLYAHPDLASFDWAFLRMGLEVQVERQDHGFTQVTYQEFDRFNDPQYVTLHLTGWVPDDALTRLRRRYFFHLQTSRPTPESWNVLVDNHHVRLFWAPVDTLPAIVSPQDTWLDFIA